MTNEELFKQVPLAPQGALFAPVAIEDMATPHPYCITPKHVAYASDHYGGMLGKDAIREAEKQAKAYCDICKKLNRQDYRPILSIDEHENLKSLVIEVPAGSKDLNDIEGLHTYLMSIKEAVSKLGVDGFAFPARKK